MKNEKWYWFVTSEGEVRAFANFSLSYGPDDMKPEDHCGYPLINGREYMRRGHVVRNYLFNLPEATTMVIKNRNWFVKLFYPITEHQYCKLVRV